jgi:hypothetical protein
MICDKVAYDTYKEAVAAINAVAKRTKTKFKSYKCKDCGKHHLTSMKHGKLLKPMKERKYPIGLNKKEVVMKFQEPKPIPENLKPKGHISLGRIMTDEQAKALKQIIQLNQNKA